MRVFLTGFMGSGKTTVGRLLADTLGYVFVDLDQEVVGRAGRSIKDIFETEGEPSFRRLEREELLRTRALANVVVATGGGIVTLEENRDWLAEHGVTVWLNPTFATIGRRIGEEGREERPLFSHNSTGLRRLFRERLDDYSQADVRLDIRDDEEPPEIVSRLVRLLRHEQCDT